MIATETKEPKLALITGATSGIGRAYARYFAAQGYNLMITGRRQKVIQQEAAEIKSLFNTEVEIVLADLTKKGDMHFLMNQIDRHKHIDVLVNNAGYGSDVRFSEDYFGHQMDMLKVHVNVPLLLIHKILPDLKARKTGIIINVSSLAAYMPTAVNSMYSGTKSFLVSFTESLYLDVHGYGIKVQCLCPGYTRTDFHRNVRSVSTGFVPWMTPEEVVEYSISCLNKDQVICIPGFMNRVIKKLSGAIPRHLYYSMASKYAEADEKFAFHPLR